MRVEFRTLKRAISMLVILCVLFIGMGLDVSAHQRRGRNWERNRHERGRNWGRSHNRGRHLGWTRGRRVGQRRHDDDSNWRRRMVRRDRRSDRRTIRRQRRSF
ncbi:MAG TPA: hypothetical protein VF297_04390 [Pyrinomonadaceae bacterium]